MDVYVWIGGTVALVILGMRGVIYAVCVLLRAEDSTRESVLTGALYGSLVGIVVGPVAIFVLMLVLSSLYEITFLGLELLGGPIIGALACGILGAVVAAIREIADI